MRNVTTWRTAILLEGHGFQLGIPKVERNYSAIRTRTTKYVEYEGGFRELYDLSTDPYELDNNYNSTTLPPTLAQRMQALKTCAAGAKAPAVTCQTAEGG